ALEGGVGEGADAGEVAGVVDHHARRAGLGGPVRVLARLVHLEPVRVVLDEADAVAAGPAREEAARERRLARARVAAEGHLERVVGEAAARAATRLIAGSHAGLRSSGAASSR